MRRALELRGQVTVAKLIRENLDRMGDASTVCDKFGIPLPTLNRHRNRGNAIAFRPDKKTDFLYPLDQFEAGRPKTWAAQITAALGNGAPAIHFLDVPREDLDGRSIAEDVNNDSSGEKYLRDALISITTE